jgi:hypothetical protein
MYSIRNRISGEGNLGSVAKIFMRSVRQLPAPALPIKGLTPADEIFVANDWTFPAWLITEFVLDNCVWEEEEQETPHGILYKEKITWTVAKNYSWRRPAFDSMEHEEFGVLLIDNNGAETYSGTFFGYATVNGEKKGMRFSKKKTTGARRTDQNHWTLTLYMESHCMPWAARYLPGTMLVEPFPSS